MQYLLTPGPVPIPTFVQQAIAQPVIYHRNADFEAIMSDLQKGLRYLFQTKGEVLAMIGSGTTGVEALLYSLLQKGDALAVANLGKFSSRWEEYGKMQGYEVHSINAKWGDVPSIEQYLEFLAQNPHTKALLLTHCETSTGTFSDIEEIAFAVKAQFPNVLILVDGISSIGAIPFYMDAWQIDGAVVAAQKALMNQTGTVYFALSEAAIAKLHPSDASDFFNLWNYLQYSRKNSYPYSPPISQFYGVIAALNWIQQETLPTRWNAVHQEAKLFRAFAQALGWNIFGTNPADCVTALSHDTKDSTSIKKELAKNQVIVSGGQDELKGKIIRIAHYFPLSQEAKEILKKNMQ